jgi:hypothetical protein
MVTWVPNKKNAPVSRDLREKEPRSRLRANFVGGFRLDLLFAGPIAQTQELADFSPFVTIFLGFGRSIVGLTEGMFSTSNRILNHVQRLCHTFSPLLHRGAADGAASLATVFLTVAVARSGF